jgi:hypothetical protein
MQINLLNPLKNLKGHHTNSRKDTRKPKDRYRPGNGSSKLHHPQDLRLRVGGTPVTEKFRSDWVKRDREVAERRALAEKKSKESKTAGGSKDSKAAGGEAAGGGGAGAEKA